MKTQVSLPKETKGTNMSGEGKKREGKDIWGSAQYTIQSHWRHPYGPRHCIKLIRSHDENLNNDQKIRRESNLGPNLNPWQHIHVVNYNLAINKTREDKWRHLEYSQWKHSTYSQYELSPINYKLKTISIKFRTRLFFLIQASLS